jgi:3'-phosphoadenosine 5'-phosphosulfate (PAPS) 3'-phosphatase
LFVQPYHYPQQLTLPAADLVTETDQAVEKMVSTRLLTAHPNFKLIGEETYYPGQQLTEEPTFIIDPWVTLLFKHRWVKFFTFI